MPLPVQVYHVTLFGGDDSSARGAVVGVARVEAGGTAWSPGAGTTQCDVLETGERAAALVADVVVDVVTEAACLRATISKYQLYKHDNP